MTRTTKLIAYSLFIVLVCGITYEVLQRIPRQVNNPEMGEIRVYPAWWRQHGFLFMFSGLDGWNAADSRAATDYARAGNYVVGIDTTKFLALKNKSNDNDCVYLPGILEGYSREQQRHKGTASYQEPALLGRNAGATLVYMTQLQSPPLAFSAAVAINPVPELALHHPFCDHAAASMNGQLQTVRPEQPNQTVPLRMMAGSVANSEASAATREFVNSITDQQSHFTLPSGTVYDAYQAALDDIAAQRLKNGVADLPLVEVQPEHASNTAFAILYSGDGGWRDLDQTLAGVLADKGMPVVGVDVLRYYWHDKPPQPAAHDLERIIRYYQQAWHRQHVVLIGFSFGANVLPFLFNRLPADLQASTRMVTLLSPERTTAFAVDPTNWLHIKTDHGKLPIAPELEKMPKTRVHCIYGQEESDDSLCTLPAAAGAHVVRKTGGHHFDENYDQLADDILAALH